MGRRTRRGRLRRRWWTAAQLLGGGLVLGFLVHRFGSAPFRAGLAAVDLTLVLAALALTLLTTACSAGRWRIIAAALGAVVPLRRAIGIYYRSQFLNASLPGGVVGDARRAWRHGLRSVVWDRFSGQVVQVLLAVGMLAALPSPFRPYVLPAAAGLLGAALVVVLVALLVRATRAPHRRRPRPVVLAPAVWPTVLVGSTVAVAGHLALFVLAARAAGAAMPWTTLLPVALLVLLASSIPFNVAGWGPREGAAAWAFGAAGVGAATGLAAAVVYGTLVLIATAPGALLLAVREEPA